MIKEKEFTANIAPGLFKAVMDAALAEQEDIEVDQLRGVAIEKNGTEDITSYKFLVRYNEREEEQAERAVEADDDFENEELGQRQGDCSEEVCESCQ